MAGIQDLAPVNFGIVSRSCDVMYIYNIDASHILRLQYFIIVGNMTCLVFRVPCK